MPRRPAIDRYSEMPNSRTAIEQRPATTGTRRGRRAPRARRARSACRRPGSRNAPERVAPSRRASQPSRLSVAVIANHSPTVSPRRTVAADQRERRDRDEDPRERDEVGRRRERALPEPLARELRARAVGHARRGGRPIGVRLEIGTGDAARRSRSRSRRAGRRASLASAPTSRTMPSISGASRCVRPTSTPSSSTPSTSTSIVSPTSASARRGR